MPTALIIGASRGLGLGLAEEYLRRGWSVIGTVRGEGTKLHELVPASNGRLRIEMLDITDDAALVGLRDTLDGQALDLLFVNAGIANGPAETVTDTTTDGFVQLMLTNALGPLRALEALIGLVVPDGTAVVMSSGLGSVGNNTKGGWEVYRASKAALNTLTRSFALRQGGGRTVLVMAPGWVRTDMGGSGASLDVGTSVRGLADTIAARRGSGTCLYVDYQNTIVAW